MQEPWNMPGHFGGIPLHLVRITGQCLMSGLLLLLIVYLLLRKRALTACYRNTIWTALGISLAAAGFLLSAVQIVLRYVWWKMVPPLYLAVGSVFLLICCLLTGLYIRLRKATPSPLGIGLDLLTVLVFLPGFYGLWSCLFAFVTTWMMYRSVL